MTFFLDWVSPPAPSGITLVASSAENILVGDSLTLSLPGTPLENDLVVIIQASDSTAFTAITETGYTRRVSLDATPVVFALDYKFMGGTPDTTVEMTTVGPTGNGNERAVVFLVLRGVNQSTTFDVADPTHTTAGVFDPLTLPSITTATDGALVVACGMLDDLGDQTVTAYPSGYSNEISASTGRTSNGVLLGVSTKLVATAGAEAPGGISFSADDEKVGYTFALRPA